MLFGKELNTSGGVVKHPIYIYQKRLKQRNLTFLGEWLSILYIYISKEVEAKELNTSGGVVKHPEYISKEVEAKELNTSGGVVKHPIYIKRG